MLSSAEAVKPLRTDADLVRSAQEGDRTAFGELYVRYYRVVHGIVLARIPALAVEDCVHEVFLGALRDLGRLGQAEAFPGWLCAIARHRAADYHRRAPKSEDLTEFSGAIASQSDAHVEAGEALLAIRSLPAAYSETLMLRLVEGLTGPEIAERTGLTPGSVRVNLHRGMQLLRQALGKEAGDG